MGSKKLLKLHQLILAITVLTLFLWGNSISREQQVEYKNNAIYVTIPGLNETANEFESALGNDTIIFHGDAYSDFVSSPNAPDDVIIINDPGGVGDVGMPDVLQGIRSGWDMKAIYFYYSHKSDIMYVGFDFEGICGDADGDGDPGGTDSRLEDLGGTDYPNLEKGESVVLLLDTDDDVHADVAIGVNDTSSISNFGAYERTEQVFFFKPEFHGWWSSDTLKDIAVEFHEPINKDNKDLEFTIHRFSTLPNFNVTKGQRFPFGFLAFAGAGSMDDGIGDDFIPDIPGKLEYDFGDLPEPYATLQADTGAIHLINRKLCFGEKIDGEKDGQPSPDATGDDSTDEADEDGISISLQGYREGSTPVVAVKVKNETEEEATIWGWIDYNCDGKVQLNEAATKTTSTSKNLTLTFPVVPSDAFNSTGGSGYTFARFRIGTNADSVKRAVGYAPDGEVQDYQVTIIEPASIGNRVWQDMNRNGLQDPGEPDIGNISVQLLDEGNNPIPGKTAKTNNSGFYKIDGLFPGKYKVKFRSNGYKFTLKDVGNNDLIDSDADPVSGITDIITLENGENDTTVDAGLFKLASIGDCVWEDLNYNGIQENGEKRIPDVIVKLLDQSKNIKKTTTTKASGEYSFADLEPGKYYVQFIPPNDYFYTLPNQGEDDCIDSDPDTTNGITPAIFLKSGENNDCVDAGFFRKTSVGDYVWEDRNGNGCQDEDEEEKKHGIPNVTVKLIGPETTQTTETDSNGIYTFTDVSPGRYVLQFLPDKTVYKFTEANRCDNALDSDVINPETGLSGSFTVVSGTPIDTLDAGLFKKTAIGDYVWEDLNGDGMQTDELIGIPGVKVTLLDKNDVPIQGKTTITDAKGKYAFLDLNPGEYKVKFDSLNYQFTLPHAGTDRTIDSDVVIKGCTDVFTIFSGEPDSTIDAGLYQPVFISGVTWEDVNRDGLKDDDENKEPLIGGVTVRLLDSLNKQILYTKITESNGFYKFDSLPPATYIVEFTPPSSLYKLTVSGGDSYPDPKTGQTDTIKLNSGQSRENVNAGFYKQAVLGDWVWEDSNYNGIQDEGESGIKDITVNLLDYQDNSIQYQTDVTDSNGKYRFLNVDPGTYTIEFKPDTSVYKFTLPNQGSSDSLDSDPDTLTGKVEPITIISGQVDTTIDAGLFSKTSVGDFVWEDRNGNGCQDEEEKGLGIPDIKVILIGQDTTRTTVTDSDGIYTFTGVYPGKYVLQFMPDTMIYKFTKANQCDDALDSDVIEPQKGFTDTFTVVSGIPIDNMDAGLFKPTAIGDYVWEDTNGNGIQDDGNTGIKNINVVLCYTNKVPIPGRSVTPNDKGKYKFYDVNPGKYIIHFQKSDGYEFTLSGQGADCTLDSDADSNGYTQVFTVFSGEPDSSIDAGLYRPVSIGDFVWEDLNKNGIQENEPGIASVEVNLILKQDTVQTTYTDTTGKYEFKNIRPDSYILEFINPDSSLYEFTLQNIGDDATDSDPDSTTGLTGPITLFSGQAPVDTVDAGFYKFASIGDFVWEDLNYNGIQDSSESGLPGVKVILLDSQKDSIGIDITKKAENQKGEYCFENLSPGSYYVHFILPADACYFTKQLGDSVKEINSDANCTGLTKKITLTSGERDTTIDAGIYRKASIGDLVWNDDNENGKQDPGEKGIHNIRVLLLDSTNQSIPGKVDTTNNEGKYLFDNLDPGTYAVKFHLRLDYGFTKPGQGEDNALDSDADPATGLTNPITVISGQFADTVDAGLYRKTAIGDYVWLDLNGNGLQDPDEPGVKGVMVELLDSEGNPIPDKKTYTDCRGKYCFKNLAMIDYIVKFTPSAGYQFTIANQGNDDSIDSDADPDNGCTQIIKSDFGNYNDTIDAGLVEAISMTSAVNNEIEIPKEYSLSQNFPNPFNPETHIKFGLPKPGYVTIDIYNIQGKRVTQLVAETKPAGYHEVIWDGTNSYGNPVANGTYFYRIKAEDFCRIRKMVLLK